MLRFIAVSETATPSGDNFNIDYKEPSRRKMSKDKIVNKVKNAFGSSEKVAGKTA
jgi:hypothetical protein